MCDAGGALTARCEFPAPKWGGARESGLPTRSEATRAELDELRKQKAAATRWRTHRRRGRWRGAARRLKRGETRRASHAHGTTRRLRAREGCSVARRSREKRKNQRGEYAPWLSPVLPRALCGAPPQHGRGPALVGCGDDSASTAATAPAGNGSPDATSTSDSSTTPPNGGMTDAGGGDAKGPSDTNASDAPATDASDASTASDAPGLDGSNPVRFQSRRWFHTHAAERTVWTVAHVPSVVG